MDSLIHMMLKGLSCVTFRKLEDVFHPLLLTFFRSGFFGLRLGSLSLGSFSSSDKSLTPSSLSTMSLSVSMSSKAWLNISESIVY